MTVKKLIVEFVSVFLITLLVVALVQLIWNLTLHHLWVIDWEMPFTLSTVFGLLMTLKKAKESRPV